MSNAAKYRFGTRAPFPAPASWQAIAKTVPGVASAAAPLCADWQSFFWTSPIDNKPHLVRVFAFDPDAPPVFLLSGIADQQAAC